MLRNLTERVNGMSCSGTPRVGLLGADILADTTLGDYGSGVFVNDSINPAKVYRALVLSHDFPAGGWVLNENGGGQASAEGSAVLAIYEDNLLLSPTEAFSVAIGPATAPAIAVQPQPQAVPEGGTATFSVVATGSPVRAYQWRRNGTAISGATSNRYTTPAVTAANDGDVYSCTVTNAQGSVTSNTAALSVTSVAPLTNAEMRELLTLVREIHRIHGLLAGQPLTVGPVSRQAGPILQLISTDAGTGTTTVTRT